MATSYRCPNTSSTDNLASSRYTDVKEEPVDKLLTPINGYQNAPLLPLEEAISAVSHFFIDLEENVYIAKYNCQNPEDELTQDESAAIHLYTMQFPSGDSLYAVLNQTLRAERRTSLIPWFPFLKLFITALFKLESVKGVVWRGVKGIDLSSKYKTGMKFAWWGVSSCTTTPDVLEATDFLGKTGTRTLFSIECIAGKSIKKHSHYSDTEKEVVLMPGTFFEVVGQVDAGSNLHIIHLKEIQPPFPLIKPPFVQTRQESLKIQQQEPLKAQQKPLKVQQESQHSTGTCQYQ
ncbi:unnamed protein product [Rotaria sordida]|uniref:NAD(P)(+)--arginine ADP-ribosyltransferase n=1 Tax=Rotaria sordida TaxID=392033 RepID=A0A819WGT1_9BILA|nr:unnamed protein product [Rotaria sordida]